MPPPAVRAIFAARQFHTSYGNPGKVLPYAVWKILLGARQAPHIACMKPMAQIAPIGKERP